MTVKTFPTSVHLITIAVSFVDTIKFKWVSRRRLHAPIPLCLLLAILGKRLSSYGGYLTFSIFYTARDVKPIDAADVIISTSNGFLIHSSIEQPPPMENWTYSVKLSEDQFKNLDGSSLSREQFLNGLQNVFDIYIRAAYDSNAVTSRLVYVLCRK